MDVLAVEPSCNREFPGLQENDAASSGYFSFIMSSVSTPQFIRGNNNPPVEAMDGRYPAGNGGYPEIKGLPTISSADLQNIPYVQGDDYTPEGIVPRAVPAREALNPESDVADLFEGIGKEEPPDVSSVEPAGFTETIPRINIAMDSSGINSLPEKAVIVEGKVHEGVIPPDIDPADLFSRISARTSNGTSRDGGEIKMELHPESLGHLKITIRVEGGIVKANILAENHAVREVIGSNLMLLKTSLEEHGLRVDHLSVGIDHQNDGRDYPERGGFFAGWTDSESEEQYHDGEDMHEVWVYGLEQPAGEGLSIFV